jgi:hypothetical protein
MQSRRFFAALFVCGTMFTTSYAADDATTSADLNSGDRKFVQMTADMGAREVLGASQDKSTE